MTDTLPKVQVAVVQAAPILFDREAAVEKTCHLTAKAATQGAKLILFPRGIHPGLPARAGLWHRGREPQSSRTAYVAALLGQRRGRAGPRYRSAGGGSA